MAIYELIKLDIFSLSADAILDLYSANNIIVKKYGFLNRTRNINEYKFRFLTTFASKENELFVLKENDSICGILTFEDDTDWGGNKQYKLGIKLCTKEINPHLVDCLRQFVHEKLEQHGFIAITVHGDELDELIKGFSTKVQIRGRFYTVSKADIDANMLEKTAEIIQMKNPDLRMEFMDIIPEEYIKQFTDLWYELQLDMPDAKEDGYTPAFISAERIRKQNSAIADDFVMYYRYVILNENNEMIAQSNVNFGTINTRFPYQFMIGVSKRYRGRGLGKWLYAAMYQKLLKEVNFEKAYVGHHPENKHIISISEWIGYKFAYKETTYAVQAKRGDALVL